MQYGRHKIPNIRHKIYHKTFDISALYHFSIACRGLEKASQTHRIEAFSVILSRRTSDYYPKRSMTMVVGDFSTSNVPDLDLAQLPGVRPQKDTVIEHALTHSIMLSVTTHSDTHSDTHSVTHPLTHPLTITILCRQERSPQMAGDRAADGTKDTVTDPHVHTTHSVTCSVRDSLRHSAMHPVIPSAA